jgi:hypothetical protein
VTTFVMFDGNDKDEGARLSVAVTIPPERASDDEFIKAEFLRGYRTWAKPNPLDGTRLWKNS